MRLLVGLSLLMIIELQCSSDHRAKIFYINSYHKGYPPSDEVELAIMENLRPDSFNVRIFHLDAKRRTDSSSIASQAQRAVARIIEFKPDVVLASDDAAIQYIIQPFQESIGVPVIYCGVNWSSTGYDLTNAAGVLEVLPLREMLLHAAREYPHVKKITILSEDTEAEERNQLLLDTLFRNCGYAPTFIRVQDFKEWKAELANADSISGLIYLPTNGAIKDWNTQEAIESVNQLRSLTVTCDAFMMPYCSLGFLKIAGEQGVEASKMVKRILKGESPDSMRERKNVLFEIEINQRLMDGSKRASRHPERSPV